MSVIHLKPPLTDIAGWLRRQADWIDSGADVETVVLVCVGSDGTITPAFFGDCPRRLEAIGALEVAAAKLVRGEP